MRITDPLERYTVKLKTKDKRNQNVFLVAKAVGNMIRYINHSCETNYRIEELNGDDGPEIAIVASPSMEPDEKITANYGPAERLLHV
ncbi:SET domain-containing protein [Phytophthora infestans]|uniref:SET domain-containing protein n=1 Tax=Phytophthora infestans TaxID=4787 RepID=A0A833SPW1_PHYIN|nr:SET domain-containing protein [Phytophthora infestans]KAF4129406.1 SET domain-containing protein [Phytophthora infestans]